MNQIGSELEVVGGEHVANSTGRVSLHTVLFVTLHAKSEFYPTYDQVKRAPTTAPAINIDVPRLSGYL